MPFFSFIIPPNHNSSDIYHYYYSVATTNYQFIITKLYQIKLSVGD